MITKDPITKISPPKTFGGRLKLLIGQQSGRSFAKDIGISYSTLHNYLIEKSLPTLDNIVLIADHLNISIEWLVTGRDIQNNNIEFLEEIDDYRGVETPKDFYLQHVNPFKAFIIKDWFINKGIKVKDCALFTVIGDVMEPTLKSGECVVVNLKDKKLLDGIIFLFDYQNTFLLKKVQITSEGINLVSEREEYKTISFKKSEIDNLNLIGRVVRSYRDF